MRAMTLNMDPMIWTFVVFVGMWIIMGAGFYGALRLLNERSQARKKGEKTWEHGL